MHKTATRHQFNRAAKIPRYTPSYARALPSHPKSRPIPSACTRRQSSGIGAEGIELAVQRLRRQLEGPVAAAGVRTATHDLLVEIQRRAKAPKNSDLLQASAAGVVAKISSHSLSRVVPYFGDRLFIAAGLPIAPPPNAVRPPRLSRAFARMASGCLGNRATGQPAIMN